MAKNDLKALRTRIDALDQQLLALINERAECARQVGKIKQANQTKDVNVIFYRPEREAQVLRGIMANNQGPLKDEEIARLFREIMSACLALEDPVKVAYLGPEGTFTQHAAIKHFGRSAVCLPMSAIDEVFREVCAGAVNYGVVPVENSSEGIVNHTLDSFMESSVHICGEVVLRIHQHLMVSEHTRRNQISRIYSHSQSFAQCRKWLDAHWPMAERVAVNSNAEAAKRLASEWNAAAIAGDMAADLYGLEKIAEKIEDRPDNSTRFLIIGNEPVPSCGHDKTSIIVEMRNEPGALLSVLEPFQIHNIDLTRIESRPSLSGTWNYVFFIDFDGHQDTAEVQNTLERLSCQSNDIKVLGSYPKGVL
ncbi:P-protein [invertebrate metagenome]|uniref:Bifunctional chorismate mutase/prephenate dehydratase n=1 Tax=invertebrate metagenome TaxID=1711999 RepID=A0A2H9T8R9_9ZZZZ